MLLLLIDEPAGGGGTSALSYIETLLSLLPFGLAMADRDGRVLFEDGQVCCPFLQLFGIHSEERGAFRVRGAESLLRFMHETRSHVEPGSANIERRRIAAACVQLSVLRREVFLKIMRRKHLRRRRPADRT